MIKNVKVGPVYAFVSYTWSLPLGDMLAHLKAYKRHLTARGVLAGMRGSEAAVSVALCVLLESLEVGVAVFWGALLFECARQLFRI